MKFILTAILFLFMAAPVQAAQVPVYDDDAQSLFDDIKYEMDTSNVPYVLGNLQRTPDADMADSELETWACALSRNDMEGADAAILFRENKEGNVLHTLITCTNDTFDAKTEKMLEMMLVLAIGMLEPIGLPEKDCGAMLNQVTENPEQGIWKIHSGDRYYNLAFGRDEGIVGFVLYATDKDE